MTRFHSVIVWSIVGVLLLLLVAQLASSINHESQTYDEACHIYAGYRYWKHRDYGINPEHPPLVKLLAAVPLLGMQLREPSQAAGPSKFESFLGGRDFLYSNQADKILFRARLAAASLSLLLALVVFLTAREMFGELAAFIALAIVILDPNILANGALVTTDIGISCFLLATVYAFYRYVKVPTFWRLATTGLALGLAFASKHTGILLVPILVLLAFCELMPAPGSQADGASDRNRPMRLVGALGIGSGISFLALWVLCSLALGPAAGLSAAAQYTLTIALPILFLKTLLEVLQPSGVSAETRHRPVTLALAVLSIIVVATIALWSFYGFRYSARPADLHMNPPLIEFQQALKSTTEQRGISTLAGFHLLPEAYLYGMVDIRTAGAGRVSYLLGKLYPEAKWFYFPVAFVIKSTAPLLTLICLSGLAILLGTFRPRRELLFLIVPIAFYFIVAMYSGLNIGIRHVLPVYPLLAVLVGGGMAALVHKSRRWAYLAVLLLAWQAATSFRAFPAYLAYSNEFWGGSANTYRLLTDSNVDWGQQLESVARYLQQNKVTNCYFAYLDGTLVDLDYYRIPCKPLTVRESLAMGSPFEVPSVIDGPVLISATILSGAEFGPGDLNPYTQFKELRPTAVIDDGVFVFNGHFDTSLASALNHAGRAQKLADDGQFEDALHEAQLAVNIAPVSISAQVTLGDILVHLNRSAEAQVAYRAALVHAQELVQGDQEWITAIKNSIAASMIN